MTRRHFVTLAPLFASLSILALPCVSIAACRHSFRRKPIIFLIALAALFLTWMSAPRPVQALDIQFIGDLDLIPISPLQNEGIVGGGGTVRFGWEYTPDWNVLFSIGSQFFPTSTANPAVNVTTYEANTGGLVSLIPVTVGISHTFYRLSKTQSFFALADGGVAFEYGYGNSSPTPEPYVEAGGGFDFQEFFIEETVSVMPLAFGAYQPSQPGTLVIFTTGFGVHFFQF
jgi:hypothetical protein